MSMSARIANPFNFSHFKQTGKASLGQGCSGGESLLPRNQMNRKNRAGSTGTFLTIVLLCLLLAASGELLAQPDITGIRGRITDKDTQLPLPGAFIQLFRDSLVLKVVASDESGWYRIDQLPAGSYQLNASFIGFLPVSIENVVLQTGRETILNIELQESAILIDAVEVSSSKQGELRNEMALVSARKFDVSETERYAGSRGEPSRMAANFAGVQGADDSRNDMVVRGNSPQSILWMLEGIPVSNPNHFNIPGTAGGSVSILNNKTLANSDFYSGAFPAEFGNATSAVFDLKLRSGNNRNHEMIGQFGFLGTELLAEGPLSRQRNYTYLTTYRYSSLALIGNLGINYGTAAIPKYQDASFHLHFPGKGSTSYSLFGIAGTSSIDILISDQLEPELNIYGSNDRDQYFDSRMAVIGASATIGLSDNTYLKSTLAWNQSHIESYHEMVYRNLTSNNGYVVDSLKPLLNYQFTENKLAHHLTLSSKLNRKWLLKAGILTEMLNFQYIDSTWIFDTSSPSYNTWLTRWNSNRNSVLQQYYLQTRWRPNDKWQLVFGIHGQYFELSKSFVPLEPRFALKKQLSAKSSVGFGAGIHRQTQPYYLYFFSTRVNPEGNRALYNLGMDFTRASHSALSWDYNPLPHLRIKTEVYYQYIDNIPVEKKSLSFSLANTGSGFSRFFPDTLQNSGVQINKGIELTVEKSFSNQYYFLFTGALFDARYKAMDGKWRNADFNGRFAVNALFAREFQLGSRTVLNLGSRISSVGGRWYGPADISASNTARELVVIDSLRNTLQFPTYFRADLKVSCRINAKKVSHEIGIDLVNLFDTRNVLSLTFAPDENQDPESSIRKEYQLGRLPLFYYRISFTNGKGE
jgi:hypothetical protein